MSALPEALLVCSVCRQGVPPAGYDDHLRQAHGLFTYRGVHRLLGDTLEALRDDLISTHPTEEAWRLLVGIARDQHGDRADTFLATLLASALAREPDPRRTEILLTLAPLVASGQPGLIARLAGDPEPAGRLLALLCLGSQPFEPRLLRTLRALLLDRELPGDDQVRTLAAVWPGLEPDLAVDLVGKLTAGLGRAASIDRLRALERETGAHPAIGDRLEALQQKVKMVCPRCGVEMRRAAMEQHLWVEHRLILEGLRARDPWSLIEEWVESCRAHHNPGLMARCRVAAAKVDPDGGPTRLARLALARGVGDAETRRSLLAAAREEHAACCPWCYAQVPVPREVPAVHVNLRPGRLSAGGYEVYLDERRPRTRLEVHTPAGPVYRGRHPDRTWTVRGRSLLAAAPLVLAALAFACFWPMDWNPLPKVAFLLALAALAFTAVRLLGRLWKPSVVPVLELTWRLLVPHLHARGFDLADSAFLAGLARLHAGVGLAGVEIEALRRLVRLTEQAVGRKQAPPGHLAALCRLWIEREVAAGNDPLPYVVALVARAFEGKLPLPFVQQLLEDWATSWWTRPQLARLRILLCDRAFEAGFEVRSLLDAGENAPALGTVLGTREPRALAALRLVWSLRATKPWERLGEVHTAFELAGQSEPAEDLAECPDVLLWKRDPACLVAADGAASGLAPATIWLTTAGVWLQGVLFTSPPRVFEVRRKTVGYQMTLGREVFRSSSDLDPLSRVVERWFRYAFHDFIPQIENVEAWQSPDRSAILRAWGAVPCPECSRYLLARPGEVGIALDEGR